MKQPDIVILLGELNVKIGDDNWGLKNVTGRHGLDNRNENGDMFTGLCELQSGNLRN